MLARKPHSFILQTADRDQREIYAETAQAPAVKFFAELFYKKATNLIQTNFFTS